MKLERRLLIRIWVPRELELPTRDDPAPTMTMQASGAFTDRARAEKGRRWRP
jgi:hypothetical protein